MSDKDLAHTQAGSGNVAEPQEADQAGLYADLIARLEAAEVGSRELDCALSLLDGYETEGRQTRRGPTTEYVFIDQGRRFYPQSTPDALVPRYTTSLDAAVALVERKFPGWCYSAIRTQDGQGAEAYLWDPKGIIGQDNGSNAPTLALALCKSLLKALATLPSVATAQEAEPSEFSLRNLP